MLLTVQCSSGWTGVATGLTLIFKSFFVFPMFPSRVGVVTFKEGLHFFIHAGVPFIKLRCAHIQPLGKLQSPRMLALSPKPGNWEMLQTPGIQSPHWNCRMLLMLSAKSSDPWLLIECVLGYKPLKLFQIVLQAGWWGLFPLAKKHTDFLAPIIFYFI